VFKIAVQGDELLGGLDVTALCPGHEGSAIAVGKAVGVHLAYPRLKLFNRSVALL
jgi:hypothetical protein